MSFDSVLLSKFFCLQPCQTSSKNILSLILPDIVFVFFEISIFDLIKRPIFVIVRHRRWTLWIFLSSISSEVLMTAQEGAASTAADSSKVLNYNLNSDDPLSIKTSNNSSWLRTMKEEIEALELNQTWKIIDLPKDRKPIRCKWIFTVKLKDDGSVDRFKAKLVAKGFN